MVQLYDGFGRLIRPEKRPDDRVLAVASVRDNYSGYPSNGLTPQKLATILKEADSGDVYRQMELFEEMEEKDAHLYSNLQTRKLAVTGLDFEIVPFSEDRKDREVADFVANIIHNLPDLEDNLLDMLDAVGKGYSVQELYWDIKNNKNVIRHMEWVHPKRFIWYDAMGRSNTPRLLTDDAPMGVDLPAFKFLFHKHKTKSGHPTRQGVLRVVAWMYLFKNYDIKDWVVFAETYGMPLRLGKYDPSATKEDKDALIQAIRSLGSDAAGVISKSTEIAFVEAVKNSTDVYSTLADFCNAETSKAILGQTLTTQQGANGSRALGQVHNEVRGDLKKADCEQVSKGIRRDVILPLVGFNFGWEVNLPWFRFDYEEEEDLKSEADRYKVHIESGMAIGEDHMYEKFNIPKPKAGERTVNITPPSPLFTKEGETGKKMANKEIGAEKPKDTMDHFTDRLMLEADLDPMILPIEKLLGEVGSLEEFRDRLLNDYKGAEPVELGNLIQRALGAAELAGRFEAQSNSPNPP